MQVAEFMMHLLPMEAWEMGEKLSCNEQTIGFKGMHKDKNSKLPIKLKAMDSCAMLCAKMDTPTASTSAISHHQHITYPRDSHLCTHGSCSCLIS